MREAPFVSVLVLNWNGKALLPRCLDALSRTAYPQGRWEAVLVDNASTDGSLESTLVSYPWVVPWRNPANWGFARGYLGPMAASPGPYVVLLNSDTQVTPGWLRALVGAAESDPQLGAATAKLVYPRHSPHAGRIQNAGGVLLRDGSGRDRGTLVRDGRVEHELDEGQYDRQEEVFFFCGAAVLLRTAALEDTGGFDPRYFMYYEDLDLSWRLRLRGWKVVYVPTALVEHEHAASSGEWSPFFRFHVERNRPLMLLKLAPWALAGREGGRYLAGLGLNAARVLGWAITRRQRGPHASNARLQARVVLSWLPDLPGVLDDRRRIRSRRRVPDGQITRWMR
jgi:hypothetical protein